MEIQEMSIVRGFVKLLHTYILTYFMVKILNLYAGLGGNRKLWKNVEVTAVEQNPTIAAIYKSNFPDDVLIVGDAHDYLLNHFAEFDFIWSSPPCQSHSKMMIATKHKTKKYPDMVLWQEIIFLQNFCKTFFLVENVKPYYEPLIKPSQVVGRHYFWSNFFFMTSDVKTPKSFIGNGTLKHAQELKSWLGINYEGEIYYGKNHDPCQVLRNCVHPEIGRSVLSALLQTLESASAVDFNSSAASKDGGFLERLG